MIWFKLFQRYFTSVWLYKSPWPGLASWLALVSFINFYFNFSHVAHGDLWTQQGSTWLDAWRPNGTANSITTQWEANYSISTPQKHSYTQLVPVLFTSHFNYQLIVCLSSNFQTHWIYPVVISEWLLFVLNYWAKWKCSEWCYLCVCCLFIHSFIYSLNHLILVKKSNAKQEYMQDRTSCPHRGLGSFLGGGRKYVQLHADCNPSSGLYPGPWSCEATTLSAASLCIFKIVFKKQKTKHALIVF